VKQTTDYRTIPLIKVMYMMLLEEIAIYVSILKELIEILMTLRLLIMTKSSIKIVGEITMIQISLKNTLKLILEM
jgi:hypothetical protein